MPMCQVGVKTYHEDLYGNVRMREQGSWIPLFWTLVPANSVNHECDLERVKIIPAFSIYSSTEHVNPSLSRLSTYSKGLCIPNQRISAKNTRDLS